MNRLGVAITDPLVKYKSLLATGLYSPDASQHRLAIHLQKVYVRLKDYSPANEFSTRLKAVSTALGSNKGPSQDHSERTLAIESHPIWRNPLFSRSFAAREVNDGLALVRVLTSHEAAINIDSPQGLFLSGEVGTGKTMLLDLLADGLPTDRKKRWHFNTFMLYVLSRLEKHRVSHQKLELDSQQYSIAWMANELIEKSPILFLDEFQLPDRAASKILSNLFTAFFQLGGVLIASSNRVPEELENAIGADNDLPRQGGLFGHVLGIGRTRGRGELFGSSSDFANFLQVLKARCEFWQMEGGTDWRRRDTTLNVESSHGATKSGISKDSEESSTAQDVTMEDFEKDSTGEPLRNASGVTLPKAYFLTMSDQDSWTECVTSQITSSGMPVSWDHSKLIVYGRSITIPRTCNGTVYWDFEDLVKSYGPADYITMASTFNTFIIDNIPILTTLKKNEARRLITLLDALYEARCKLLVRAEAGPDDLFFPKAKLAPTSKSRAESGDAILPETIAEVYQDQMSPFRPNVSTYSDGQNTDYDEDQDSDFGVDGKRSRLDFSNTGAFTGEDERFAYKRAASRLWELCSARWHAREGDWWQPLPLEARHWESAKVSTPLGPHKIGGTEKPTGEGNGPSVQLDELAGLQRYRIEHFRKGGSEESAPPKSKSWFSKDS